MSNSIWHTADEKPEDGATIAFYLKDSMGSGDYDYDENEILVNCGFIKFSRITKWATLDDLIAQADKAERLEKENEAMRDEFELWHYNHKRVLEELESARRALKDHSADASKMVGQN